MTTATANVWDSFVFDEAEWTFLEIVDEVDSDDAPAPLFLVPEESPLDAMRARLTRLAAQYPLGARVGTTDQFIAELERGEELRDEAHILLS